MKFSIIVPAHNEEKKIFKALDSIKAQSFTDYELIVVCDACTDCTYEVAQKYTDKVLCIDGHSSAAARNAGLDIAKGDWVLFCDADDWYLHEFVFQQLADKIEEEKNNGSDVILFSLIWAHMGYGKIRSPKGTIYPHVANKCWKRASIGDTRFPENIKVGEDSEFFDLMQAKGIRMIEWDMPLYYYNWLNPGSKSVEVGRTAEQSKKYWSEH